MFFDSAYTALSLFLPMHFDILICLGILMFDFILFGNLWTAWISVDVSINKLEIFLALISSSNISFLCSLLFFVFQKFTMQILFFRMLSHRYIFLKLLNTLPFFCFLFWFFYLSQPQAHWVNPSATVISPLSSSIVFLSSPRMFFRSILYN